MVVCAVDWPKKAAEAQAGKAQRLYDVQQAAEYLRAIGAGAATVNFIRGLIATSQVPRVCIGKRFYVSREALDRWITTHELRAKP